LQSFIMEGSVKERFDVKSTKVAQFLTGEYDIVAALVGARRTQCDAGTPTHTHMLCACATILAVTCDCTLAVACPAAGSPRGGRRHER